MSNFDVSEIQGRGQTGTMVDAGLKSHMQSVYNRMTMGLLITAVTAYIASNSPMFINALVTVPFLPLILALSPLAVIWFGFNPRTMSSNALRGSFVMITVLYGLSFSTIFLAYLPADIVRALLMTTIMFAGLSIFGYTTKRDLGPIGVFCVMGMFGLLAFTLLYMLGSTFSIIEVSPAINNIIAVATIVIFAGLTAWDTQVTKEQYNQSYGAEGNSRLAWMAALNLFINFIAIFQSLLQLLSNRE